MTSFRVTNKNFNLKSDSSVEVLRFEKESVSVYFIGKLYFDKKLCENIIFNEKENIDIHDRIDDSVFQRLNGDYYIVVVSDNNLSIFVGYSFQQLYIWSKIEQKQWSIIVSEEENHIQNKRQNYDNLTLGLFSHHSFYVPRGYFLTSDDFILPGMKMQIDRKSGKYSQTWFYPINQMVVRDDHKNIAIEVAETLVNEFSLNSVYDKNLKTIQVSSGLDSALFVAAAEQSRMDYIPINFLEFGKTDEQHGANTICKYFGKKIKFLNRGTTNDKKKFTSKTDISSFLNKTKDLLKRSSGQFILNHISLLAGHFFGFHTSFEGSSYPTQLCIKHHTNYPFIDPRKGQFNSKFQPEIFSDLRYEYSINSAEHKLKDFKFHETKDQWEIGNTWPEIHPYYWHFLGYCFTQTPNNTFSISKTRFPYLSCIDDYNYVIETVRHNGNEIISKILLDENFKKELSTPNSIVATKLTRFISFILNAVRANNKSKDLIKSKFLNQVSPGMCSQMLRILHSVKFDNVLTNYPKWHLFKAFELLSGKKFFEINNMTPYKKLLSLVGHKLMYQNKVLNKYKTMLSNESLNNFCSLNNLDNKFSSIINSAPIQVKKDINKMEKTISSSDLAKFWYLNKKLNIVFMSLSDT